MKLLYLANTHLRRVPQMRPEYLFSRHSARAHIKPARRWNSVKKVEDDTKDLKVKDKPIKFTASEAHRNYIASRNFYGDEDRDLPNSHNYVLAGSGIFGIFYLIFLRDDIEADGGKNLIKPLHETVPQYAIPLLQSAIAENRKLGHSTQKLEKKLAEYMKEPDKYGGHVRKFVEN